MSKDLRKRIHDTLMKVLHMQGGARIGVGGARKSRKPRKMSYGGVGVGGRKKKRMPKHMSAGVLMDDLMHPDYYGPKRGRKGGVLMDDLMHPDFYSHPHKSKKGGVGVGGRKKKKGGVGVGGVSVGGRKKRKGGAPRGGANPWIAHVKKFAKQHGLTYGEALKKARKSY